MTDFTPADVGTYALTEIGGEFYPFFILDVAMDGRVLTVLRRGVGFPLKAPASAFRRATDPLRPSAAAIKPFGWANRDLDL